MSTHSRFAPALVYGFGTAAAMWVIGFVTHLPGIETPAPVVGVLLLITKLVGAALCARAVTPQAPILTATLAGLVSSCVNLLILGSVLVNDDGSARPDIAIVVAGWIGSSIAIAAVGAIVGLRAFPVRIHEPRPARAWAPAFAAVCVGAAVPVLFSGGLVTSNNAGLAVPDWPTSFNANMFLYPLSKMTGGIYYEHAHRLFGSFVGLTTLVFACVAFVWKTDTRVRITSSCALALIVAQGYLGGLRVTGAVDTPEEEAALRANVAQAPTDVPANFAATADNNLSIFGAILHGVLGQLTLAFLLVMVAIAMTRYAKDAPNPIERRPDPIVRYGSMAMMVVLFLQLVLGSLSRHMENTHSAWTHTVFAFVVFGVVGVVGMRAMKHHGTPLPKLGATAAGLLAFQILLGFATLALVLPTYDGDRTGADPPLTALVATLHQITGAGVLGTCALLHVWGLRCTTRATSNAPQPDAAIA